MRPQVRIIDNQKEEIKPANISRTEEEALLAKYGYGTQTQQPRKQKTYDPNGDMTFDQLCQQEEQRMKDVKMRNHQKMNGPKPITFDGDYNSNTTYSSDEGASFKVTIVTDMHLPK